MSALILALLGFIALGLEASPTDRKPPTRHRSPENQLAEEITPTGYLDESGNGSGDPQDE